MLNQNLFLSTLNAYVKNKIHFDKNFLNGILNDEEYLKPMFFLHSHPRISFLYTHSQYTTNYKQVVSSCQLLWTSC